MVVHTLGLEQRPLLPEAKALGNPLAPSILNGALHLYAVQLQLFKGVIDEHAAGLRHETFALKLPPEPVADFCPTTNPVDVVVLDLPGHLASVPDGDGEALVLGELREVALDEGPRVLNRAVVLQPRRPLFNVRTVLLDEGVQMFGVPRLDEAQLGFVVDFIAEHMNA